MELLMHCLEDFMMTVSSWLYQPAHQIGLMRWLPVIPLTQQLLLWLRNYQWMLLLSNTSLLWMGFSDTNLAFGLAIPALHTKIIAALHNSPLGGHSGILVTLRKLKQYFAWKGMKSSVHAFVSACGVCKQAKPDRAKYPGLLQPLPIPEGAWHTISLDFVEGLPKSSSMDVILVAVDKFSKYIHFLALSHPFSAFSLAHLFMMHIYKLHGLPVVIISDRDRVFLSQLWQDLFKLSGVTLKMSSAYHPKRRPNWACQPMYGNISSVLCQCCPKQWFR